MFSSKHNCIDFKYFLIRRSVCLKFFICLFSYTNQEIRRKFEQILPSKLNNHIFLWSYFIWRGWRNRDRVWDYEIFNFQIKFKNVWIITWDDYRLKDISYLSIRILTVKSAFSVFRHLFKLIQKLLRKFLRFTLKSLTDFRNESLDQK